MPKNHGDGQKKDKKQKTRKIIRRIFAFIFLCATIWIFLPVFELVFHAGMLFGLLTGFLFCLCAFPKFFRLVFRKSKVIARIVTIALIVVAVWAGGTFAVLVAGGLKPARSGGTIIVLGCQVYGETPSLMLERRIHAAIACARNNLESKIIASGGQGPGETISEAECIRRGLLAGGIEESRIYLENKSTNTEENLKFSAEIIGREGLNVSVMIVTNRFHEYRALRLAAAYGLDASPAPCSTQWWLAPGYWGREIFAVWRLWVFGH